MLSSAFLVYYQSSLQTIVKINSLLLCLLSLERFHRPWDCQMHKSKVKWLWSVRASVKEAWLDKSLSGWACRICETLHWPTCAGNKLVNDCDQKEDSLPRLLVFVYCCAKLQDIKIPWWDLQKTNKTTCVKGCAIVELQNIQRFVYFRLLCFFCFLIWLEDLRE